jgi:hypothetical protein
MGQHLNLGPSGRRDIDRAVIASALKGDKDDRRTGTTYSSPEADVSALR